MLKNSFENFYTIESQKTHITKLNYLLVEYNVFLKFNSATFHIFLRITIRYSTNSKPNRLNCVYIFEKVFSKKTRIS